MKFEQILYETDDAIATVTLNRPQKLNALTRQMEEELFRAMNQADRDDTIRVIILTGAGRGFCSGADMSALDDLTGRDLSETDSMELVERLTPDRPMEGARPDFQKCYSWFPALTKPVLAAINGPAAGMGFVLTLFCDIRFASDKAKFSTAFSRRGLIAEQGISWMLPRLVGLSNALDLLYSARMIDAAEALRLGLVNRVEPHDSLMNTVQCYAAMLATEVSPRSLREMKREVYDALFQTLGEAIDTANLDMAKSLACEDFREGVAHYLEKRPPRFTGN